MVIVRLLRTNGFRIRRPGPNETFKEYIMSLSEQEQQMVNQTSTIVHPGQTSVSHSSGDESVAALDHLGSFAQVHDLDDGERSLQ